MFMNLKPICARVRTIFITEGHVALCNDFGACDLDSAKSVMLFLTVAQDIMLRIATSLVQNGTRDRKENSPSRPDAAKGSGLRYASAQSSQLFESSVEYYSPAGRVASTDCVQVSHPSGHLASSTVKRTVAQCNLKACGATLIGLLAPCIS